VLRVLAMSGGYSRDDACKLLAEDPVMIASFSRALLEGLTDQQSNDEFNTTLDASVAQIFDASVAKSTSA
jgi:fructose-bisphosphate aldolase class I